MPRSVTRERRRGVSRRLWEQARAANPDDLGAAIRAFRILSDSDSASHPDDPWMNRRGHRGKHPARKPKTRK